MLKFYQGVRIIDLERSCNYFLQLHGKEVMGLAKEIVTTIRCDICGNIDAESHSFLCDRMMDAAGSMENVYYDVDLCSIHFCEFVRQHGHPSDYSQRLVNRSLAIAYGSRVKDWIESYIKIWKKMTSDERELSLAIEAL